MLAVIGLFLFKAVDGIHRQRLVIREVYGFDDSPAPVRSITKKTDEAVYFAVAGKFDRDFFAFAIFTVNLVNGMSYELIQKTRLKEMADQMLDMLATAREALEKEDIAMANSLFEKDNIVDEINAGATAALAEYIAANPDKAAFCLDFKGVFLRLERAGDHITNLAEEIVFYIDAVVLKHSADKGNTAQAVMRKAQEQGQ